ncbi:MAG TPA: hypothetical protein VK645_03275 [Chitinophagaceae bacterium]|nr:hypothetical protein [Chitinophagaceae bacterium]
MKYLQRLLVLLTISAAIFSCQKEYSIENPGGIVNTTAQWEFKEGGVQFKGPIDTASIDTISNYKFLTIIGRSDDGSSQITLQVFGADLKVGTYKTPFSLFAYIKGGTPVYQTDQTATDSFTIVITKADINGVTGTFSGKALNGTTGKTIVDGKFSAVLKPAGPPVTPGPADSGQVLLWSKAGCAGGVITPINVSVSNKTGQITQFVTTEPGTCNQAGAFSVKLPVGTYPWVAKCSSDSVTGTVTVTKDGCTKQEVNFAAVPTGDYFPMTTNSNWSYLFEASTPDDTLYILSTGVTKPYAPGTFNLFTNDYGTGKDSSYYRKTSGSYYEYYPAEVNTFGLDAPLAVEHIFLKDNVAQGATWESSYSGLFQTVPVTAKIRDTLSQKITSYSVSGKTYSDVLEVHSGYFVIFPAPVGTQQAFIVKQWFAKGVGLIKYYQYDVTAGTDYTLDLTRSKIN